jgi:hypothetical protein
MLLPLYICWVALYGNIHPFSTYYFSCDGRLILINKDVEIRTGRSQPPVVSQEGKHG